MSFVGKHALVIGLGESGLAMAQWLSRCGARVRVADTRTAPARLPQLLAALPEVEFCAGELNAALLEGVDLVGVSPGLSPLHELAALAAAATQRGLPLWSEIELFAQALAALREQTGYQPKVIAITGTNGKTTVTSMTGLLCERAGLRSQVAGNISPSALDMLRTALEQDQLPQVWVLELSSFQLHFTDSLVTDAATVLNLSQDHLDWHGDMAAYAQDKARIFRGCAVQVLNREDVAVMQMAVPLHPTVTFGSDVAQQAGSFGLSSENGMQWLSMAVAAEDSERKRGRKGIDAVQPVSTTRLMPADALKIRGQHNAVNALAALALCRAIGLPLAPLLHALRDFHGAPHRVELVATIAAVAYYDDSKGTNVGASVAALNGLGAELNCAARLVLIAGGDGKQQDFTPLAAPVARHARAVLLIGRDAPLLRTALAASGAALIECSDLADAVQRAASIAEAGDAVLLSPACASFDMFRNYVHRAEVFVDAVRELALQRGEVLA